MQSLRIAKFEPAPVLTGSFRPQWVLNAVMPTPRLEYEMNRYLSLYAGATMKEASYRVDEDFGDSHGISRLNNAILTYSEIRTGAGFDWKISPAMTFTGEDCIVQ